MKGQNLRTSVRITFEEAVFGCEKEIEMVLKDECQKCHGTGANREPHQRPVRNVVVKVKSYLPSSPSLEPYRMYRPVRTAVVPER